MYAMTTDRLTALETSFLYFERPGRPIHVGATAIFEAAPLVDGSGRLRLDEVRQLVESRLEAYPRLRQKIAAMPLGLGRPRWVDDGAFDITRHVEQVHLGGRGETAFRRLAEDMHARLLDLDHPPWHMCFVTGLGGGRVGMIDRAHHAMVDGVGGVDLATVVLDVERDGWTTSPPVGPPVPAGNDCSAVVAAVRARLGDSVRVAQLAADRARHPLTSVRATAGLVAAAGSFVQDGLLAPRTSLGVPPGWRRRVAWVRTGLAEAKAVGADAGATVNDVALTAVAGGLRSLLLGRGEAVPGDLVLKALVPVSVRRPDEAGDLGNRVSGVFAPLPVGIVDPAERLGAIAAATLRMKGRHEASATDAFLHAADLLPPVAIRALVRGLEHQASVNLVVTNVPGPPFPLYFYGARMLEAFPAVPLAANMSVGAAILSYDGALTVSLTADADACPDVDVLAAGIERDLDELGAGSRAVAS
jgi:diacylglycerol O-acyltransferase / wax synthase